MYCVDGIGSGSAVACCLNTDPLGGLTKAMFPGLPGDPPIPETGIFLSFLGASISLVLYLGGIVGRSATVRRLGLRALLFFVCFAGTCAVPIGARNFGRWSDLKIELRKYGELASEYEQEFGRITNDVEAERFYHQHPPRWFSFGSGRPRAKIVYLWWHEPGRPGIVFGRGGTAAFHLPTMLCVYSD